ncbi:hypothetical protein JQ554_30500 [Bradyrhizobium diazoefficiens]|nr:hypothetical protein [Bradyrhizobium diazoefficiens]MBR0968504.1 hypothetical protein [Bradyrhizobium diazoefficiens]MBR0981828.1 hypothetical protein [Bradyrhizobium diazoefficiens]MBR1011279.1 hypothetical protein [Bradyrhizobium diazoefficiens]MBR1015746.1 hypothetical protein [Bradyrhizobium diazoefficiens]MBR1055119.1 hypothetical protein [Bradyrhizobium diazoefficiens]
MSKVFGEGIYSAYRQDGILHVRATGLKPTAQTIVTIEELPFLIFPPRLGLFFETDGITNPVVLPFDVERAFPNYPAHVTVVNIVDKNGVHTINIVEKPAAAASLLIADPAAAQFVVYQQIGTDHYLIAKSDDVVLAIYYKVFGPDTYANCQAYVAAHARPIIPAVEVVPGTFSAWINRQPGVEPGPRFIATVDAIVEVDWNVTLISAVPQGFNPLIKLLRFDVQLPPGPKHSNALIRRTFRFEESPPQHPFTDSTIENGPGSITTPVREVF